jgi:uncharacterized protein YraI
MKLEFEKALALRGKGACISNPNAYNDCRTRMWVIVSEVSMIAKSKSLFLGLVVLLLAASACLPSPPTTAAPTPVDGGMALTVTALYATVIAQTATFPTDGIPSATEGMPIASETPSPIVNTSTLTNTPTLVFTPSPGVPMVSVTVGTNCRTGPGRVYDRVGGAQVGVNYVIVGKSTPTNYWIILLPDGRECWLWGRYAIVAGNVASLPEIPAPPRPTPVPALGTILVTVLGPSATGDVPIDNATVTLSTGERAQTLGNGLYLFVNVSAGTKEIWVTAPNRNVGYGAVTVTSSTEPSRIVIRLT